jgi:hypothetical protein
MISSKLSPKNGSLALMILNPKRVQAFLLMFDEISCCHWLEGYEPKSLR